MKKTDISAWIAYHLAAPFLYLLSHLPFTLLYTISTLMKVFIYRIFRYRLHIVRKNLKNSFPEKSRQELRNIEKRFYAFFCDLIFETIKTIRISRKQVLSRIEIRNTDILEQFVQKNQSIIIATSHHGNWELAGARYALTDYHQMYIIYHPLHNPYFDEMMYRARTRLGNKLYTRAGSLKSMIMNKDLLTATTFLADQTPHPNKGIWMQFLHQDTIVFQGLGKIANKFNYPVVYSQLMRTGRGRYLASLEVLINNPHEMSPSEITEKYVRRLENEIREQPETWLWTHRRWKHKRKTFG